MSRCLLAVTRTGSVVYYDLEAETIIGVPLIPSQIEGQAYQDHPEVLISVDMDKASPVLAFNIAFSLVFGDYEDPSDSTVRMIQIWRVNMVLEDQHGTKLTAIPLASLPLRPEVTHVKCLSILGCNVAFSVSYTSFNNFFTFVVDWTGLNGNSLDYPRRLTYGTKIIHLLPRNRLIIMKSNGISLYDFSSVKETYRMPPWNYGGATHGWGIAPIVVNGGRRY